MAIDMEMNKKKILTRLQSPGVFACVMNLVVLILLTALFYVKYQDDNDLVMQALLYGVSNNGISVSHLLFSNILWGKFLSFLVQALPAVPWYPVIQYICVWVCLCLISYVIVRRNQRMTGRILAVVLSVFVGYECYITPSYVETASLLSIAAVFVFASCLSDATSCKWHKWVAVLLALLGSLISFSAFLVSFLLAVVALLLVYGMENRKSVSEWTKTERGAALFVIAAVILIPVIAVAGRHIDCRQYTPEDFWEMAGQARGSYEKLYSVGFPSYEDVADELQEAGFANINEVSYSAIQNGYFPFDVDIMPLLHCLSRQHRRLSAETVLSFFRSVPLAFFKTGMFYLWAIFVTIYLLACPHKKSVLWAGISLGMIFLPQFVLYFCYGTGSRQWGLFAYLPAILYLLLHMRQVQMEDMRQTTVYFLFLGLVLYYLFSGNLISAREDGENAKDVIEVAAEGRTHLHLLDFNTYISRFSVFTVYPQRIDADNCYLLDGIYQLVPGFRKLSSLAWPEGENFEGADFYVRSNEAYLATVYGDVYRLVPVNLYVGYGGSSFHSMTNVVYPPLVVEGETAAEEDGL